MIALARLIEAWRDAQIFKEPMKPRGRAWHLLKYPQYGLWLTSLFLYTQLPCPLWVAFLIVAIDICIAYFVFEYFLEYFRS